MRAIAVDLDLLEEAARDRLDDEALEHLDQAREAASRCHDLVDALVTHAKLGSNEPSRKPVDAGDALQEALENLAPRIDAEQAIVSSDDLPLVQADRGQLVRIFQNLVGNSVKFHGDDAPRIHVGHRAGDGEHEFSVRDNGVGIPADQQGELFERMTGGAGTDGSGMGLALCRRVVENHEGRIWVVSEPGEGATFHFTIAADPPPLAPPEA